MKYSSTSSKSARHRLKPPGYAHEFMFVTVSAFLLKLYSQDAFNALSFFTICLPVMLYLVINVFGNLLKFIQFMHIEEESSGKGDDVLFGLLTPKQAKLLQKVALNLLGYFGLYFLTGQLDNIIIATDTIEQIQLMPAAVGIIGGYLIKLYMNYQTRQAIKKRNAGLEDCASASLFSWAGLTTVFNAITQTTTTVCANGQCFTIYSNTIAGNMAAFGVSMTAVNTYLVPLCCILLTYSVWCLYKGKRSFTYKPFLMGLSGAILIALDNFVLGERLNLSNIPSWIGNAFLIIATIWAGRDTSKENNNPFGV